MLSFKSIAVVVTLAFGAITSFAAPVESSLVRKDANVTGVAKIISDVTVAVTPLTVQLQQITADNCTADTLTPVINDINNILNGAVTEVNKLVGQPVQTILATVDGAAQITVGELAQIIAALLNLVLAALGAVLKVASGDVLSVVTPLLASVGTAVGALLTAVLSLVSQLLGGLLAAVLGLVGDVLGVVTQLNVAGLTSLLGLNL
ncbi:hypothetical protein EW026_g1106 [Hermanssonia centrifuga]|uniref:Uncharacterized protein n=2 Tax=Hermanssonia centrifuga TaxID=98765 RepID=A0A4S4KT48_9APHY|nr:hypothetical protein PHLCEN_2v1146 [Hermanssonia centrifuga]THH01607.1 hypothetical protein EW026_g1106 [Hermanssonia centrifuga]